MTLDECNLGDLIILHTSGIDWYIDKIIGIDTNNIQIEVIKCLDIDCPHKVGSRWFVEIAEIKKYHKITSLEKIKYL